MKKNTLKRILRMLFTIICIQLVVTQSVYAANPFKSAWNKVTNYFKPKKSVEKTGSDTLKEYDLDGITYGGKPRSPLEKKPVRKTEPSLAERLLNPEYAFSKALNGEDVLKGILTGDKDTGNAITDTSDTSDLTDPNSVSGGVDDVTAGANNSDVFSEAKSQYPDLAPWYAPYKFHKNTQKERKESGEGFFMNKSDGLHEIEGSQYTAKDLIVVTEKGDFDLGDYGLEESNMVSRNRSKTDKVVMKYREGVMDFVTQRIYFTGRYIEYKPSASVKIQKGKRGKKGDEVKRVSTYNKLNLRVSTGQKIPGQNFLFGGNVEPTLQAAQDISNHVNVVTGDSLAEMLGKQAEVIAGESVVKEDGSENKEEASNKESSENKEADNKKDSSSENKNTEAPDDANLIIVHWLPDGGENMPSPKKKLRNSQKPATGDGTPDGSNAAKENQSNLDVSGDIQTPADAGIPYTAEEIKADGHKIKIKFSCYSDGLKVAQGSDPSLFRSVAMGKPIQKSDGDRPAMVLGSYLYVPEIEKYNKDGLLRVVDTGGSPLDDTKPSQSTTQGTVYKFDLYGKSESWCSEFGIKGDYDAWFKLPTDEEKKKKTTNPKITQKTSYLNNQQARQYVANLNTENTYLSAYEKAYDTMTSIFIDEVLAEEKEKENTNETNKEVENTENKNPGADPSRADPTGDNAGGLNPGQGMGSFTRTAPDAPPGIYIIRNNSTVRKDRALIGWLQAGAGQEKGTYPKELLSIILEMKEEIKQLSFEETYRMQQIKEELEREKDNIWYDATTMISVMVGYLLITYAMVVVVIYWFDVFNVYTRGSIMMIISFGKWYPVSDKANLHIPKNQTNPKYVDFKDILIRAGIIIVIAVMFIRITPIISFIVNIKNEIAVRMGGLG